MDHGAPEPTEDASPVASAMADAASRWLAALNRVQRDVGFWAAPGGDVEQERRRWFYTPTDHGGLALGAQSPLQQRFALTLVAAGLSAEGFDLVATILGTENVLDRVEGFTSAFDTERGRDPSRYYLRVFGEPGTSGTWGWRFGGHHVSLSYLVRDGKVRATTPRFLGLDPATTRLPGGTTLAPFAGFDHAARRLLRSLDAPALEAAVLLDRAPSDIVMGNRPTFRDGATMMRLEEVFRRRPGDVEMMRRLQEGGQALNSATGLTDDDHWRISVTAWPKGVPASSLNEDQRRHLAELMAVYQEPLPASLRPTWNLDELHFMWAGSTRDNAPHYYRIQGDGFLVEWDNTSRGANHAHGVVRHVRNDFGADVLGSHRKTWH